MTLQEERLRHLLHQAAPNPTTTIDAQAVGGKARRRHRARVAVSALAITAVASAGVATFATLAAGSNNGEQRITTTPGPSNKPTIYTGVGTIVKSATGPARLCLGLQFTTGPFPMKPGTALDAYCSGGVTLRGLLLDQLPVGTAKSGAVYTQPMRVTGTYRSGILTLTRQPQETQDRPTELWSRSLPLPCAAPTGGWSKTPMTEPELAVVNDYVVAHPDTWGNSWFLNKQTILVESFTRDLDAARKALRSVSDHVCVTKATRTYAEVQTAMSALALTPADMDRLHVNGASVDPVKSQLVIGVVLADGPIKTYVAAHFKPGLVRLQPFLTPVGSRAIGQGQLRTGTQMLHFIHR